MIVAELLGPDGLVLVIALIVLLLFGGAKLPKLARGLGTASHEFRKGVAEGEQVKDEVAAPSAAVNEHD